MKLKHFWGVFKGQLYIWYNLSFMVCAHLPKCVKYWSDNFLSPHYNDFHISPNVYVRTSWTRKFSVGSGTQQSNNQVSVFLQCRRVLDFHQRVEECTSSVLGTPKQGNSILCEMFIAHQPCGAMYSREYGMLHRFPFLSYFRFRPHAHWAFNASSLRSGPSSLGMYCLKC